MKAVTFLILLISVSQQITIKFRAPQSPPTYPGNKFPTHGSQPAAPQLPGPFQLTRSCDPLAPGVHVADLFSIYSIQLFNIFADPINELLLVKHEIQQAQGTNHRLIFRIRDTQVSDKLYYGFKVFVDLQGGVRITGFLESFVLTEIVTGLGFLDGRIFRYPCGEISQNASDAFMQWGKELNPCATTPNVPNFNPNQDDLNDFHDSGSDSPFDRTIKVNIKTLDSNGREIIIGNKRPSRT